MMVAVGGVLTRGGVVLTRVAGNALLRRRYGIAVGAMSRLPVAAVQLARFSFFAR